MICAKASGPNQRETERLRAINFLLDTDHLRVDPALRLALGKEHESGARQSALCGFENKIPATCKGLKALEDMVNRSAGALLRRRNKLRLILDVDSTEDPVHGNQEGAAFNGYFEQVCYHPLFCFTSKGDLLGAKLRPGNAHSADGALEMKFGIAGGKVDALFRYKSQMIKSAQPSFPILGMGSGGTKFLFIIMQKSLDTVGKLRFTISD